MNKTLEPSRFVYSWAQFLRVGEIGAAETGMREVLFRVERLGNRTEFTRFGLPHGCLKHQSHSAFFS
jgi:hypothetical protein